MSTITAYPGTIVYAGEWTDFTTARLGTDDSSAATLSAAVGEYKRATCRNFDFSAISDSATINSVTVKYQLKNASAINTVYAKCSISLDGGWTYSATTTERSSTSDSDTEYNDAVSITPTVAQVKNTTNFVLKIEGKRSSEYAQVAVDLLGVTIAYSGVAGPTMLKTRDGIAKASIKTICGVAIASIKSVDSIT